MATKDLSPLLIRIELLLKGFDPERLAKWASTAIARRDPAVVLEYQKMLGVRSPEKYWWVTKQFLDDEELMSLEAALKRAKDGAA